MSQKNDPARIEHHPIRLETIAVQKLCIELLSSPEAIDRLPDIPFAFGFRHHKYNEKENSIQIDAHVAIGMNLPSGREPDGKKEPFPLKVFVEISGIFSVNPEKFPVDKIPAWADGNGVLLLVPYLRENIHALAIRCGIRNLILPLMQIPTFKIEPANPIDAKKKS